MYFFIIFKNIFKQHFKIHTHFICHYFFLHPIWKDTKAKNISDYFQEFQISVSRISKYLKKLDGFEVISNYVKYLYSLINSGNFNQGLTIQKN